MNQLAIHDVNKALLESIATLQSNPFDLVDNFGSPLLNSTYTESLDEYKKRQEVWLDKRFDILAKAEKDANLRDIILHLCKINPIFFINLTSVAFNPIDGGLQPLILFNRQVQAILAMNLAERQGKYLTMLKSRYVGASVFTTAYLTHSLLFKRDWSGLLISRVLSLVDGSNDADTLFAKVDLAIDYLPHWIKPKLVRKLGLISNGANNTAIKGAGGKNAGRGGRASVVVVDEAAFVDNAASLLAALSNTTKCVIMVSTPNGRNEFCRMCTNKAIPHFTYHWTSDPRRDEAWYEGEKVKFASHIIAQELDLSFDGSQEDAMIDTYKLETTYSHELTNNSSELVVGLDIAAGGANNSVLALRRGRELLSIEPLDKALSVPQQARYVNNYCLENGVDTLVFDADGIGITFKQLLDEIHDGTYGIVAFHGGAAASDRELSSGRLANKVYGNARSEAYHTLRDSIDYTYNYQKGNIPDEAYQESQTIKLINVLELVQDLGKPRSIQTATGKLMVESKQSMKLRGLESPDFADALAYCFYDSQGACHDTSWLE